MESRPITITSILVRAFDSIAGRVTRRLRMALWTARLLAIGEHSYIHPHVVIHQPGNVVIGDLVAIAEFVHMWGGGGIEIGDRTIVASHAVITSLTHDASADVYRETLIRRPVRIGSNVWIGAGAIILPGVTIGDNAIVGAGSLVNRDVEAGTTVVGIPSRILRPAKGE